jgi:hypothetical protein
MMLSEGQMSDYKGAALMVDALRTPKPYRATAVTMPLGSARL